MEVLFNIPHVNMTMVIHRRQHTNLVVSVQLLELELQLENKRLVQISEPKKLKSDHGHG